MEVTDAGGKILKKAEWTYDADGREIQKTEWTYDADGTLTDKSETTYAYNAEGHVIEQAISTYGADGETLIKSDITAFGDDGIYATDRQVTEYSDGVMSASTHYDYHEGSSAGNVKQTTTTKYASDGETIVESDVTVFLGDGETITDRHITYYSEGVKVAYSTFYYDAEGNKTRGWTWSYDAEGNTVKSHGQYFRPDGTLDSEIVFHEDAQGNTTESHSRGYNTQGEVINESTAKYYPNGEYSLYEYRKYGENSKISYRGTFEYYEDGNDKSETSWYFDSDGNLTKINKFSYLVDGITIAHREFHYYSDGQAVSVSHYDYYETGKISEVYKKIFDSDGTTPAEEDIKRYLEDGKTLTDRDVTVYSQGKKVSFTDYNYHGGPSAGNVHEITTKKFASDETTVVETDVTVFRGDGETKTSRQVKEYSDGIEVSSADHEYDSEGKLTRIDKSAYSEDGTTLLSITTSLFNENEQLISEVVLDANGTKIRESALSYDAFGNLIVNEVLTYFEEGHENYGVLSHKDVDTWHYDESGDPTAHEARQFNNSNELTKLTTFAFNSEGNEYKTEYRWYGVWDHKIHWMNVLTYDPAGNEIEKSETTYDENEIPVFIKLGSRDAGTDAWVEGTALLGDPNVLKTADLGFWFIGELSTLTGLDQSSPEYWAHVDMVSDELAQKIADEELGVNWTIDGTWQELNTDFDLQSLRREHLWHELVDLTLPVGSDLADAANDASTAWRNAFAWAAKEMGLATSMIVSDADAFDDWFDTCHVLDDVVHAYDNDYESFMDFVLDQYADTDSELTQLDLTHDISKAISENLAARFSTGQESTYQELSDLVRKMNTAWEEISRVASYRIEQSWSDLGLEAQPLYSFVTDLHTWTKQMMIQQELETEFGSWTPSDHYGEDTSPDMTEQYWSEMESLRQFISHEVFEIWRHDAIMSDRFDEALDLLDPDELFFSDLFGPQNETESFTSEERWAQLAETITEVLIELEGRDLASLRQRWTDLEYWFEPQIWEGVAHSYLSLAYNDEQSWTEQFDRFEEFVQLVNDRLELECTPGYQQDLDIAVADDELDVDYHDRFFFETEYGSLTANLNLFVDDTAQAAADVLYEFSFEFITADGEKLADEFFSLQIDEPQQAWQYEFTAEDGSIVFRFDADIIAIDDSEARVFGIDWEFDLFSSQDQVSGTSDWRVDFPEMGQASNRIDVDLDTDITWVQDAAPHESPIRIDTDVELDQTGTGDQEAYVDVTMDVNYGIDASQYTIASSNPHDEDEHRELFINRDITGEIQVELNQVSIGDGDNLADIRTDGSGTILDMIEGDLVESEAPFFDHVSANQFARGEGSNVVNVLTEGSLPFADNEYSYDGLPGISVVQASPGGNSVAQIVSFWDTDVLQVAEKDSFAIVDTQGDTHLLQDAAQGDAKATITSGGAALVFQNADHDTVLRLDVSDAATIQQTAGSSTVADVVAGQGVHLEQTALDSNTARIESGATVEVTQNSGGTNWLQLYADETADVKQWALEDQFAYVMADEKADVEQISYAGKNEALVFTKTGTADPDSTFVVQKGRVENVALVRSHSDVRLEQYETPDQEQFTAPYGGWEPSLEDYFAENAARLRSEISDVDSVNRADIETTLGDVVLVQDSLGDTPLTKVVQDDLGQSTIAIIGNTARVYGASVTIQQTSKGVGNRAYVDATKGVILYQTAVRKSKGIIGLLRTKTRLPTWRPSSRVKESASSKTGQLDNVLNFSTPGVQGSGGSGAIVAFVAQTSHSGSNTVIQGEEFTKDKTWIQQVSARGNTAQISDAHDVLAYFREPKKAETGQR